MNQIHCRLCVEERQKQCKHVSQRNKIITNSTAKKVKQMQDIDAMNVDNRWDRLTS